MAFHTMAGKGDSSEVDKVQRKDRKTDRVGIHHYKADKNYNQVQRRGKDNILVRMVDRGRIGVGKVDKDHIQEHMADMGGIRADRSYRRASRNDRTNSDCSSPYKIRSSKRELPKQFVGVGSLESPIWIK
jgi:hypothetical protein